jgi:hypothetical protein
MYPTANYLSWKRAKFMHVQILHSLGYTKKDKHVDMSMYYFKSTNCIRF